MGFGQRIHVKLHQISLEFLNSAVSSVCRLQSVRVNFTKRDKILYKNITICCFSQQKFVTIFKRETAENALKTKKDKKCIQNYIVSA